MIPHAVRIGLAVCTPQPYVRTADGRLILDTITVQWHRARQALSFPTNINVIEICVDGMEVGEARNEVANRALQHEPVPEAIFFLDNDVLPAYDALTKLYYRMRTFPDHDIFAGVYCCKWMSPPDPLIYAGDGAGPYWDWTIGDLLTTDGNGITSVHMGLTLVRTSLFSRMLEAGVCDGDAKPFYKSTNEKGFASNGRLTSRRGTEDIYFCNLAREVGAKILVDTSVLAGHIDKNTGVVYGLPLDSGPVTRARWMSGQNQDGTYRDSPDQNEKKALDIGAGGSRRSWPGHRTYTTDIRADVKPDYVMDTRMLNLPDGHFDLVASSHHLEHLGRWDQEQVWREMFRVTKLGGRCEHIVPNIEWAAEKIVSGEVDEDVMNVLYGAQEAHGYERTYNLHYFGYAPAVAKALAEEAGYVDVTVRTWKDDPDLGYNLVIEGTKPSGCLAVAEPPASAFTPSADAAALFLQGGDGGDAIGLMKNPIEVSAEA